jgi:hypothetical protein
MKTFKTLMTELSKTTLKSYVEKGIKEKTPPHKALQRVSGLWKASKKITQKTFATEDGAPAGAGAAPTNVSGGLASIKNPDGTVASPPVSKKKQKTYQQKNVAAEKEYTNGIASKLRKVMGGINVS